VAAERVQVRAADPRQLDVEHDLVAGGGRLCELVDRQLAPAVPDERPHRACTMARS
jgi:hypothetical protein